MHVERSPDVSLPSEGGLAAQGMDQFSTSAVCLDRSSVLSSPPAFFLDLFAGARSPVFAALKAQGADCIEPIDKINGDHHDILADDVFEAVLRLASSTLVKVSLCAPYCSKHSRATLFPGGPLPVRTPAEPEGCASNTFEQDCALQDSAAVHDRSRHVSDMVMVHGGVATLENPARSMTWLDPHMICQNGCVNKHHTSRLQLPANTEQIGRRAGCLFQTIQEFMVLRRRVIILQDRMRGLVAKDCLTDPFIPD